ncbi:1533_t:CDS:2, partial [Gigaspora rosea]
MRSKCGTLTTKIKDAVFAVFGDSMLDWIDSNAIPEESSNSKDMQDQPTGTPEDTEDQVAVSETAIVPEISNVDAPETTEIEKVEQA